jgi:hypothetical protein
MADTDIPGWMPNYSSPAPDPRKRAIASPFGVMPTPVFNIRPPTDQAPSLMDNLWASLPTREDWKQGTAETFGAPVDMAAWALMKLGVPIPRAPTNTPYMASAPDGSRGYWAPAASVPLSSQNIRSMLDNGHAMTDTERRDLDTFRSNAQSGLRREARRAGQRSLRREVHGKCRATKAGRLSSHAAGAAIRRQ